MARILVTGGAGMIGSNLVKRLVELGHDVFVVDNLWRGKLDNLKVGGEEVISFDKRFYKIDLREPRQLDKLLINMDYVYHLADVVAGIGYVFNNQAMIFRENLLINTNVISSVSNSNIKGFIYVGTACSFPKHLQTGIDANPLKEDDQYPAAPESAYGWSKLMGEYETFLLESEKEIPVSVLSLHNVYGSPCAIDATSQVIPALMVKAIAWAGEPFVVWGDGSQGRAFVHVTDVVDALVSTMEQGLGKGLIQIGPNHCTSISSIAEMIVQLSGKKINITYDKSKPVGDKGRCADFSKAKDILGWKPKISIKDGLKEVYLSLLSQSKKIGSS